MTDNNHPITPPPELIEDWLEMSKLSPVRPPNPNELATLAARWGADTELEACCKWLEGEIGAIDPNDLRAVRRPTSNRSRGVIDRVWTYMTDEAPATHTQAELAVEAVEMWLRHQGQAEAAELLKNQQIG